LLYFTKYNKSDINDDYNNLINEIIKNINDNDGWLIENGKLGRIGSSQLINGGLAQTTSFSVTAEQLIGGVVYMYEDFTLPSATDLITLLLGPGGFDVSNNDIFSFRAVNLSGSNHTISSGTGGSGSITVTANTEKFINIKITITVSAGSTTYGYTTF